jgi:leucine dehydrogenase
MQILNEIQVQGHEQVIACSDPAAGLRAFIAIFDTTLGPALGGARWRAYETEDEALTDVLRLARALAYKCAVAGTAFGGGKAVILADNATERREALVRAFARFVDTLGGRFIVSEDVGTDTRDLEYIAQETPHVAGLPESLGGSGDPSIITALGVVMAMKSCARAAWQSDSLNRRTIAIQGFGKVGTHVAEYLLQEGAHVIVADICEDALERARALGATIGSPVNIHAADCDILSPCALGGVLNRETIPTIKATIVAGGANNQLQTAADGDEVHRRGILYAPDFVASAGGVIALHHEVYGEFRKDLLPELAARVGRIMDQVICVSRRDGIPTYLAADRIAEARMDAMRRLRTMHRATRPSLKGRTCHAHCGH